MEKHRCAVNELGSFDFEMRVRHRTGPLRWMKGRARVWPDEHGRPATTVGSAIHIRQQKDAEAALLRATQRFQCAMAAACEGLFEHALHSDDVYYSPRVYELLG